MSKILFLVIYIPLIFALLYRIVKNLIGFSNQQKMSNEYHEFSMKVLGWSREIKNLDKRSELLYYHITYIFTSHPEDIKVKWKKIPEFQKYIEDTWGGDIPSLKKQIRDRKISSILNR